MRLVIIYSLLPLLVSSECRYSRQLVGGHMSYETYDCQRNNLLTVPNYPKANHSIDYLLVSENNIEVLNDNSFRQWGTIKMLDAKNNKIRIITPLAFLPLKRLKDLNLDGNLLKLSDEMTANAFNYLPKLEVLNLEGNPLGIIPNYFMNSSKHLLRLYVANSIGGLKLNKFSFYGINSLSMLDLTSNNLQTLPEEGIKESLESMRNLRYVHFGGSNNWTCDCRMRWVKTWRLNNRLENLDCRWPPKLRYRSLLNPSIKLSDLGCKPEILPLSANISAIPGDNITLTCDVSSDPLGLVVWTKNGTQLANDSKALMVNHVNGTHLQSVLNLRMVNSSDAGEWMCNVNNGFGSAMVSFPITIESSKLDTVKVVTGVSIAAILFVLLLSMVTVLQKNKNRITIFCRRYFGNQFRFNLLS